jgi:hypothetical protein
MVRQFEAQSQYIHLARQFLLEKVIFSFNLI